MNLRVEWQAPIPLTNGAAERLIYTCDLEKLPDKSGVYVFGRRYGKRWEALYVGKAGSIRRRVNRQLQNVRLMMHLKGAKDGQRMLLPGCFRAGRAQQERVCLPLIERALIRCFLSEGHDLVNVQGTRLRQHTILSVGARRKVPDAMLLDRR